MITSGRAQNLAIGQNHQGMMLKRERGGSFGKERFIFKDMSEWEDVW
jgi:hypothetical protein